MERDAPFYRVGHSWQMQQKICQLINCKCNVEFKSWTNIQPNSFHPHTHNTHIHSVTETASFALRILRRLFDKFLMAAQRSLSTGFARIYFPSMDVLLENPWTSYVIYLSIYLSKKKKKKKKMWWNVDKSCPSMIHPVPIWRHSFLVDLDVTRG